MHGRPFMWFTTSGYAKQSTEQNFTNNTLIPDILDSSTDDCNKNRAVVERGRFAQEQEHENAER